MYVEAVVAVEGRIYRRVLRFAEKLGGERLVQLEVVEGRAVEPVEQRAAAAVLRVDLFVGYVWQPRVAAFCVRHAFLSFIAFRACAHGRLYARRRAKKNAGAGNFSPLRRFGIFRAL